MSRFFVSNEQIDDDKIFIIGNDVNHIKNVLRMKNGDLLEVCNKENNKNYECEILNINNDKIELKILSMNMTNEEKIKITIMQGIPKFDKMELIIQKSVELGVNEIIPLEMEHCVVKLKESDRLKKIERWKKISEVAAKQCMQNYIPEIRNVENIKNICKMKKDYDEIIVAYEKEDEVTLKSQINKIKTNGKDVNRIAIIIGPEGGISNQEISLLKEAGVISVTLGKRILRTETVALNMLSIFKYEFES